MNLFELVLKQMRQRSLSTWLTIFSILLAVGLAIAIMILHREGKNVFGQSDYGFDTVIGVKSSRLQLVLNSVYHIDQSPGNLDYAFYEKLTTQPTYRRLIKWAVPIAVGDSYRNHRVVASTPAIFGMSDDGRALAENKSFQYRINRRFEFAQGRPFSGDHYEAVLGSETAKRTGLKIGDKLQVTHGLTDTINAEVHATEWTVVGILQPTHTANDRVLFIPLKSYYVIDTHSSALEQIATKVEGKQQSSEPVTQSAQSNDNRIELALPKDRWKVAAILVRSRSPGDAMSLAWFINNGDEAVAANPALEMAQFFHNFLSRSELVLLSISGLVTLVAAVSILVSIYNSVSARMREIAILRALGATRTRVLTLICVEAGLIGVFGGLAGLVIGHLLGAVGSWFMNRVIGQGINWLAVSPSEWIYLGVVVVLAVLAGLVPAMKAYRSPVATNLVA